MSTHRTVLVIADSDNGDRNYGYQLQQDETVTYRILTKSHNNLILPLSQLQQIDGILLELDFPHSNRIKLLRQLKEQMGDRCPPIVVIDCGDIKTAVQAFKNGAVDYLVRDQITPDDLRLAMRTAIENAELQRELQQQQNRLQRLIDTAPIGIGIGSASGEVSVINDTMLHLHGYSREEFEQQGMNWRDFIPPELLERTDQAMEQLRQQGFTLPEEKELLRKDGTRLPIWISSTQWMDGTDEHVAFAIDLTQQKQAEAAIQQLNQELINRVSELQTLLDTLPVGIAIATDPTCTQMQSNAYIRQMLGTNRGDNISKSAPADEQPPYQVFRNGEEVPTENLPMQMAARLDVEVRDIEFDIVLPDGTARQILSYATPLRGDQNQIRGVVGAFLDITERNRNAAALEASQQRYQELAEAMPQMVWTADATGAVNYLNQRWYAYTGLSEAESMGLAGANAVHPEERDRALTLWQQAIASGESFEIEFRIRRWDGEYHWFICRALPTRDSQKQLTGWIGTITDIDNQKQLEARLLDEIAKHQRTEQELRRGEERLELAMEAAKMGSWDWDIQTGKINWSTNLERLFGMDPGSFDGRYETVRAMIHSDDLPWVEEAIRRTHYEQEDYNIEFRFIKPDGTTRWALGLGRVFYDASGNPVMMTGVDMDISERKQIEEDLRASEERFRQMADNAPMMIWVTDATGHCTYLSKRWYEFTGQTQATELGWEWLEAVHPDHRESAKTIFLDAIERQAAFQLEYLLRRQDGEYRWAIDAASPWIGQDGEFKGYIGSVVDIHDRKQAELALQEAHIQLEAALTAGAIYTWCWNIAEDVFITNCNFAHLFGVDPEAAAKGLPLAEILNGIHPDDRPRITAKIAQAIATGENYTEEYRVHTADGEERCVIARGRVEYDANGNAVAFPGALADITERRKAEEALRFSEERYRTLFESMDEGFCVIEMLFDQNNKPIDYRFLETNPAFDRQCGLDNVQGKRMRELIPNHEEHWFEIYGNVAQTGIPIRFENRAKALQRWYDLYAFRLGQPDSRKVAVLFKDISERKRAEQELQESETRFRTLASHAPVGIFMTDVEGNCLYVNERWREMAGLSLEAAQGTGWVSALHPDDRQRVADTWYKATQNQQDFAAEYRFQTPQGKVTWIQGSATALQRETGAVAGYIGTLTDITERKQTEAALQERSDHIQLLYETSRDLLSSAQPLNLVETVFNKLKNLMGLDVYLNYVLDESQQKLHLTACSGIPQEVAQQIEWLDMGEAVCGTVAQQQRQIVQADIQNSNDPNLQLARSLGVTACACQPLIAQNKLFGTLSFGNLSRTEFTASEQSLFQAICDQIAIALERSELLTSLQQQTEELVRVNRIKDEFLAVLSHELRSPLNPILGWTKLLQSRKFDEARTAEALATIERNAKLQTQLIDDLLDVAKILRGKLSLNMTSVNLSFVIEAAIETVRAAAVAKSISLHPELPNIGQVSGDSARLQQIIWNLLSNAIKFTPTGGQVDIQLQRIGNQAQITVSDTGKGISPDFLPHIFESFQQEDASITRKYGGLGLGLAIVRQLVEAHGGTITASSPGKGLGATFTVQLPLLNTEPEIKQIDKLSPQELDLTGIRVLAVDDEADARELLTALLSQYGADVLTVTSASEVLANLESFQPAVLVSDIGMPEVDGYTLIQQIRTLPAAKGGQIPAIALTAYAREDDHLRAIASGFQGHVTKPLEPEQLVQAMMSLIHRQLQ